MRKGKPLYRFKRTEQRKIDRDAAVNAYKMIRDTRMHIASVIKISVKQNQLISTSSLRNIIVSQRDRYHHALKVSHQSGYNVSRLYNNRVMEFFIYDNGAYSDTNSQSCRLIERWKDLESNVRRQIRAERARQRSLHIDQLAQRPLNHHLQQGAVRVLETRKYPKESVRSVGIEIECMIPRKADYTKFWPVAKFIDIAGDGSIRVDDGNFTASEIRICVPIKEMRPVVTKLCEILAEMGAKVNKSCGLHVHLDQRDKDLSKVQASFTNLIRAQNLLFSVVPNSRRDNYYCKKHRGTDFNKATYGGRYKAINAAAYRRHKTIEVRLFGGTINAEKIINWTETLWAIESGTAVLRCPKTIEIAKRYWALSDENANWLVKRQQKFLEITSNVEEGADINV